MLTPLIPFSNRYLFHIQIILSLRGGRFRKGAAPLLDAPSKRGENLRGGEAPLSFLLPSPAMNILKQRSMYLAGEGIQW
jgi:hypothetical protein